MGRRLVDGVAGRGVKVRRVDGVEAEQTPPARRRRDRRETKRTPFQYHLVRENPINPISM